MQPASYALPDMFSLHFITQITKYEEGMPVYLQQFSSQSVASIKALNVLCTLYNQYPNIFIVAVTCDSTTAIRKIIQSSPNLKYANLCIDKHLQVHEFAKSRGMNSIPNAFIFDGNGSMAWAGYPAGSAMNGVLLKLNRIPVQAPCLSTSTIHPPKYFNPEMTVSRKSWRLPGGGVCMGEKDPKALVKSSRHVQRSEQARIERSKKSRPMTAS